MKQWEIYILAIVLIVTNVKGQSYTLDSSFSRSDSCVQIQWTPDTLNTDPLWYITNGNKCTGADSVYRRCDFLAGQTYSGIAYSYGGEDPWFLFRNRLNQGYLAGSHLCHYSSYGDPSNRITGTDCSGFLSFLWNYPRISTVTFASSTVFQPVSFSEIRPGDALVKSGSHIVFVLEADTLTEVLISEASSTSRGCRERLVDLSAPAWASYKGIRYPALNSESFVYHSSKTTDMIGFSIRNTGTGSRILQLSKIFKGKICVISLDGRRLFNSAVHGEKSVEFRNTGSSVALIQLIPVEGNSITSKMVLLP